MKQKYKTELEGQRDFYEELGFVGDKTPDFDCNTDGCIGGTLVEFKLNNSGGLKSVKEQLKRYIKSKNADAKLLPRYSLFVNINQREFTFMENSTDKNNEPNLETITDGKWKTPQDLLPYFNKKDYIKGWVELYSVVKYNDEYFIPISSVKVEDFIEEIKNPKVLNIKPYPWNPKGEMERSILDCLGGKELRKRLGAFFTPNKYVKISTEYLRNAIKRVPKGWDYIILDRCAGTGNLQRFLTPEELSHCVLNTFVFAEWTTLKGLYDGRVRCIIPHTKDYKDPDGLLSDGDALTEEFNKKIIDIIEGERKKADGKLVVIGLENPPYTTPGAEATRSKKTYKQISWAKEQMKKAKVIKGDAGSDLCNHFIYSATNIINVDEYIIYAPIKYWKTQHLFDGKFNEGYLCNRGKFHATDAGVSLISWINNKKYNSNNQLKLLSDIENVIIKKIHNGANTLLPNAKNRKVKNGFAGIVMRNGTPMNLHGFLINIARKDNEGRVRELNNLNSLQLLPLWVANCYKPKDYTEKEVIMKSGDGGTKYLKSKNFLNDCFVWSCLTNANKCISNKEIKNELCLMQDTKSDKLLDINKRNTKLLQKWREIFKLVKVTKEYNPKFTYGLYQICRDINIKVETGDYNKRNEPIMEYKYSDLNDVIKELKEQLKEFYDKHITPKLFKYELLK